LEEVGLLSECGVDIVIYDEKVSYGYRKIGLYLMPSSVAFLVLSCDIVYTIIDSDKGKNILNQVCQRTLNIKYSELGSYRRLCVMQRAVNVIDQILRTSLRSRTVCFACVTLARLG
jgi:hypothetical protein